jgi:hypothetical protein
MILVLLSFATLLLRGGSAQDVPRVTRYQYTFKNSVGFGSELSMLCYAAFVAEQRIAEPSSVPGSHFCINRFTHWRFMSCEARDLTCFFDAAPPFQLCSAHPVADAGGVRPLTVKLDGLYFTGDRMSFLDAAKFAQRFFRPNAALQSVVDAKLARLGLQRGQFVAVHIRRGDSAWEKGVWLPVKTFLTAARRVANERLPRHDGPYPIYVATDTQEVVDYIDRTADRERLRIVIDREQIRFNLSRVESLSKMDPLTYSTAHYDQHAVQFISDLAILALEAAAFVGTLNSNIGRLMGELRNGSAVTFVDVLEYQSKLHVNDEPLDRYGASPRRADSASSRLRPDMTDNVPLGDFWSSFYGVWPPPERQPTPEHPANPLWWWRTLMYGRSAKFNIVNAKVLEREKQELISLGKKVNL